MTRETILETWAPTGGIWSLWARPILFAQMDKSQAGTEESYPASELQSIQTPAFDPAAALIVDLPGADSVRMGLVLASRGYRPVPLFNACTGNHEVIDQSGIINGLARGAKYLATLSLEMAPPAFLLDSWRLGPRTVRPGDFDNRWKVYLQDFPSPEGLRNHGIKRVIVMQSGRTRPASDLAYVLMRWQGAGLSIEGCDIARSVTPEPIVISLPWWSRSFLGRILETFGLHRGPRHGFGKIVPKPSHG